MKTFMVLNCVILMLSQSCTNMESLEESMSCDSPTARVVDDCRGNGACLPIVNMIHYNKYSSTPGTQISWNNGFYGHDRGSYHLQVKSSGITHYDSNISSSGSLFFSNSNTNYMISYSISCSTTSQCSACSQNGSLVVIDDVGSQGNKNDCLRSFRQYTIKKGNYEGDFMLNEDHNLDYDTNKFMKVDSYAIYKSKYGVEDTFVSGGNLTPGITSVNYPTTPQWYFEIRFYSKMCDYHNEHYLYYKYQGTGTSVPLYNFNLIEQKHN